MSGEGKTHDKTFYNDQLRNQAVESFEIQASTLRWSQGTEPWLLFAPNSSTNQENMMLGIRPIVLEGTVVQASCA